MNAIIVLALSCYGLPPDSQAYCQARDHQDSGYCYSIKDQPTREQCRAEVSQGKQACDSIADLQKRLWCKTRAGRG